jgi:hypothetical protein
MRPLDSQAVDNILADIREGERLSKLSDLELIKECLKTPELDHPVVEALMSRVLPNWMDQV